LLIGPGSRAERCPTRPAIWPGLRSGSGPFFLKTWGRAWSLHFLHTNHRLWSNRSDGSSASATRRSRISQRLAARNDVGRQVSFDPLVSDTATNVTYISHASAPIRVCEEFW